MTPIEQRKSDADFYAGLRRRRKFLKSGACKEALERRKFKIWNVYRGGGATEVQNLERV